MKKVIVCIGITGVGKSTYINKNKVYNSILLSNKKNNIFNQDTTQYKQIFTKMISQLKVALLDSSIEEIYCDSTILLNRDTRINLYNIIKSINKSINITALTFIKPLNQILKQNKERPECDRVSDALILKQYKSFQVPRLNVDCDTIKNAQELPKDAFLVEYEKDTPHNSIFHKETVNEHIEMCINNAKLTHDNRLVTVAYFHDLGKHICKEFVNKQKTIAHFKGHENVSAMYFLGLLNNNITQDNLLILETIYQHMNAHKSISIQEIKRNKLSIDDLRFIYKFNEIDSKSRIL